MLAFVDAWVTGLSLLATDAQRAANIDAMARLLPLFAASGIEDLDDAAAHVAVVTQPHVAVSKQPHEATPGLIGAGLHRLAAHVGL